MIMELWIFKVASVDVYVTVLMSNDDAHSSVTTNRWEKLRVSFHF